MIKVSNCETTPIDIVGTQTEIAIKNQHVHSQIEIREYYQADDMNWMHEKKYWNGLKSIPVVKAMFKKCFSLIPYIIMCTMYIDYRQLLYKAANF